MEKIMEHRFTDKNIAKMKTRNNEESIPCECERLPIPIRLSELFFSLQTMDLRQNSFGKEAMKVLCSNSAFKGLKFINLANNPLGNDGIKLLSDVSDWNELQILILANTKVDYKGMKWLAMNESWVNLTELDLSQNPLIGDFGAAILSFNRSWTHLKKLVLCSCNIESCGINFLTRNKQLKSLFITEEDESNEENQFDLDQKEMKCSNFRRKSFKRAEKTLLNHYQSITHNKKLKVVSSHRRGGFPQDTTGENGSYSELFAKFKQYKEKILGDETLIKESLSYIEPRASFHSNSEEIFELTPAIARDFLDSNVAKALLLAGEAGSGKSVFCTHFQRELLIAEDLDSHGFGSGAWLPIYTDLSRLKNPKSEAISETLARELALTSEEIHLLQTLEPSNVLLPRLLFIFDGYTSIENVQRLHALFSDQDYVSNNFCTLNQINENSWKNAKFIITCREEDLQYVKRRDLLFAPLSSRSTELSSVPGSFLQMKVEPFADDQITSYLRKYLFLHSSASANGEKEAQPAATSNSSLWSLAERYEKMLDDTNLREVSRTPFMLWVLCHILPNIAEMHIEQLNGINTIQVKPLNRRFIVSYFIDQVMTSIAKKTLVLQEKTKQDQEQEDLLVKKMFLQAECLALRLSKYSRDTAIAETGKEEDSAKLLEMYPLVEWDNAAREDRFRCPLLLEFFVARAIEEEIIGLGNPPLEKSLKGQYEMLLNQRILTGKALYSPVTRFLLDAVEYERITKDQLLTLVNLLSKESVGVGEPEQLDPESSFAIALSNAMSLLNAAKYDFSNQEFSNISIPGANFTHGIFEGTTFSNVDLRGVDFEGTWLKDATFEKANMENISFRETEEMSFKNEKIECIAISLDRKHIAVDLGDKTVIYEQAEGLKYRLRESKRLPGYFSDLRRSPFSIDGKKILTIKGQKVEGEDSDGEYEVYSEEDDNYDEEMQEEQAEEEKKEEGEGEGEKSDDEDNEGDDNAAEKKKRKEIKDKEPHYSFAIWDISSGKSLVDFEVPSVPQKIISFSPDFKEFALFKGKKIEKYTVATGRWVGYSIQVWRKITNCDITNNLLLIGDYKMRLRLCNSNTGKAIYKQRQKITHCRFSVDGKQVVAGTSSGFIQLSDSVRGYVTKSLLIVDEDDYLRTVYSCSLNLDSKIVLSTTSDRLTLQDVITGEFVTSFPSNSKPNANKYSLDPEYKYLALISRGDCVRLKKISDIIQAPDPKSFLIRGENTQGLELEGVVASGCIGLSEEDIALLQKRGNYGAFNEDMIKKLFPQNAEEAANVREIVLLSENLEPIHAKIIGSDAQWINLRVVDLSGNKIGDESGAFLGNNSTWANLEELVLKHTEIGDETATAIAGNGAWKNLRKLQLSSNNIGNAGAAAIGKNELWTRLEMLDLHQNNIGDEGAAVIGENRHWQILEVLDLSTNRVDDKKTFFLFSKNTAWKMLKALILHDNPVKFNEKEVFQFLKEVCSKSLEVLKLPHITFDKDLVRYLKYSEPKDVREISLSNRGYNDLEATVIGSNEIWTELKKLDLSENKISDEGGIRIAGNVAWVNLEEMNFSNNHIGVKCSIALGNNKAWSKLKILNLSGNSICIGGATVIAANTTWKELETLDLSDNFIAAEGASELAKNTTWTKLQTLNLQHNSIGAKGAAELAKNTTWTKLRTLNLQRNALGAKGAGELSKNTVWTELETLNLQANSIGNAGIAELLKNPTWKNLTELNLQSNSIDAKGVEELSKSSIWGKLETLNLQNNAIGNEGAVALGKNMSWPSLQVLALQNTAIGAEGALALCKNTSWTNLQVLELEGNTLSAEAVGELAQNPAWANLQVLNLRMTSIDSQGAIALSKNNTWKSLRTLNLASNSIKKEGTAQLMRNTAWISLETFNLEKCELAAEDAMAMAKNSAWKNLRILGLSYATTGEGAQNLGYHSNWLSLHELDFEQCSIDEETIGSFNRNNTWAGLQSLNLRDTGISSQGVVQLSRNITWRNLKVLNLQKVAIGSGIIEFSKNTSWTNLESLNLDHCGIGETGAIALSKNTSWVNLRVLELASNNIGTNGVAELSKNSSWVSLQTLNLSWNNIGNHGPQGAEALGKNATWTSLERLILESNSIGDEAAEALGTNTTWTNLEELNFQRNTMGAKGLSCICSNPTWKNLKSINLAYNGIGDQGAMELGKNTLWKNLQILELQNNSIKSEGVVALAKNITWTNLRSLNLDWNASGPEGAKVLSQNPAWTRLQHLRLQSNAIGIQGAVELSKNTTWTHLHTLNLHSNSIGVEGVTSLSGNTAWVSLQKLNLAFNAIWDEGIEELSKNTSWVDLRELDLKKTSVYSFEKLQNPNWPSQLVINK